MPTNSKTSHRTARTARRSARHGPAPGQKVRVVGIDWIHAQIAKGHPIDAYNLDRLALAYLIVEGDPASAQVIATIANGQRLEEILEALESRR